MNVPLSEWSDYSHIPDFESMIKDKKLLHTRTALSTMQINMGRICNLSCKHCHLEAGPRRGEIMSRQVMEACLQVLGENSFAAVDITGGAPEMNPHFRWFVAEAKKLCPRVLVRTNLVILLESGYTDLPQFFREQQVELVGSLPHYIARNTNRMRGDNVFERSVKVLRMLNQLGYGQENGPVLNLVFNPGGAFLPSEQSALEREFRVNLQKEHGLVFNSLLAITNNPLGRFRSFLDRSGNLARYMDRLYTAFNPAALPGMMCREQISVACDGALYDCDFNQAAGLPITGGETIFDWPGRPVEERRIRFADHCYACTAGQGSSCGGIIEGV